jgi:hypothetical protein
MIHEALSSEGIPAELPAAEKAAAVIRAFPLRVRGDAGARDLRSVVESRWFAGPGECLRVLKEIYRATPGRGSAFGVPWPFLEAGGHLLAPALPVPLGAAEISGPDASYELRDRVVWREAIGETRPFLFTTPQPTTAGRGPDLLWFGEGERAAIRDRMLEVEDLFSVFRVPATMLLLERYLLRPRRVDRGAIADVALAERDAPAEVEVRRPIDLVPGEEWRDAVRVLSMRVDIRSVERLRDQLVADTAHGGRVVFNLVDEPRGWRLYTWEGEYPLRTLGLTEIEGVLHYSASLGPALDPLTHGLRGRLAFDLRSDLLALGGDEPAVDTR